MTKLLNAYFILDITPGNGKLTNMKEHDSWPLVAYSLIGEK